MASRPGWTGAADAARLPSSSGSLLLWAVLLFRKAPSCWLPYSPPIAFAGAVWDHTRVWTRRWIETIVALVF